MIRSYRISLDFSRPQVRFQRAQIVAESCVIRQSYIRGVFSLQRWKNAIADLLRRVFVRFSPLSLRPPVKICVMRFAQRTFTFLASICIRFGKPICVHLRLTSFVCFAKKIPLTLIPLTLWRSRFFLHPAAQWRYKSIPSTRLSL